MEPLLVGEKSCSLGRVSSSVGEKTSLPFGSLARRLRDLRSRKALESRFAGRLETPDSFAPVSIRRGCQSESGSDLGALFSG